MAKKVAPWNKIKKEYLEGVAPKELSKKYGITAKRISDKAGRDKWSKEKAEIRKKTQESTQKRIDSITNLALRRLEDVLIDYEIRTNDLISAIGKAIEISGLKTQKHEVENKGINIVVLDDKHKQMLEDL